jgi:serine/threonine-protein kinase
MRDTELDATIEARWATIAPHASRVEDNPLSTIEPERGTDTAGARALEGLRDLERAAPTASGLVIERTIGEGGMGVVQLAVQSSLGRKVAVKTLRGDRRTAATTLRLLREAWVTGTLEHPNVVPIYDVALDTDGTPVIMLKRIEGMHWGELIHAPEELAQRYGVPDPLEWNLRILMQVCNAVHFAHSRGVIHRDLKPENVMIGEFGEVYVLDWGLAVSLQDDSAGRLPLARDATEMAGTPCYMAPEMLGGEANRLSERTDVYLLGATLYEILAGAPPHGGAGLTQIVSSVILSNPVLPEDTPAELARICQRAMQRDPDERFESAEQIRLALEDFLQHRGSLELAADAQKSLDGLLEELRSDNGDEGQRQRVYNLLGECRFGFRQALRAWSDNAVAALGFRRAISAMVDYELRHDDPRSAAMLLGELDDPPADLAERVEQAERKNAEEQKRMAALEHLGRQMDPGIGGRTRGFLGIVLGVVWTVSPLLAAHLHWLDNTSHIATLVGLGVFAILALALGVWARDSMTRTLHNRRVLGTLGLLIVAQAALAGGAMLLGVTPAVGRVLQLCLWFCIAGMFAIHIELKLLPAAIAYLVAFIAAAADPGRMLDMMAAANLVFTANVAWVWFPHLMGRGAPAAAGETAASAPRQN